jgi:hypothetical protein
MLYNGENIMSALASGRHCVHGTGKLETERYTNKMGGEGGEICGLCRTESSGVVYELEYQFFYLYAGDRSPREANAFE